MYSIKKILVPRDEDASDYLKVSSEVGVEKVGQELCAG
jgi:hypothetical protein